MHFKNEQRLDIDKDTTVQKEGEGRALDEADHNKQLKHLGADNDKIGELW